MKLLAVFLLGVFLVAAAEKKPPQPLSIPAAAVKSEDGSYRYTDSHGTKWIYRKTPFGIARIEDKPAAAPVVDASANVKATECGDSICFERPGPFGTYKWQRSKTELNDMEQAAWNRAKPAAAGQD
jgi:hypothetical protein